MRAVARVRSTSMPPRDHQEQPGRLSRDPPASVDTLCQSANIRWRPGMISSARLTECDVCRVGRAARATGSRAAVFSDQVPAHPVIPVPHLVQPSPALYLDVLGPADPCRSGQDQSRDRPMRRIMPPAVCLTSTQRARLPFLQKSGTPGRLVLPVPACSAASAHTGDRGAMRAAADCRDLCCRP